MESGIIIIWWYVNSAIFITSVVIFDWTFNEIKEIDCKTRKQLHMTENFHPREDEARF